jgi:hypothetical protein
VLMQQQNDVRVPTGEHLSSDGIAYYDELTQKVETDRKRVERKKWEKKVTAANVGGESIERKETSERGQSAFATPCPYSQSYSKVVKKPSECQQC